MHQLIKLTRFANPGQIIVNPALIVMAEPKENKAKEKFTILHMMDESAKYFVSEPPERINQIAEGDGLITRLLKFTKKGAKGFVWLNPALIAGAESAQVDEGQEPFTYCAVPLPTKVTLMESPEHINNIIGFVIKKKNSKKV